MVIFIVLLFPLESVGTPEYDSCIYRIFVLILCACVLLLVPYAWISRLTGTRFVSSASLNLQLFLSPQHKGMLDLFEDHLCPCSLPILVRGLQSKMVQRKMIPSRAGPCFPICSPSQVNPQNQTVGETERKISVFGFCLYGMQHSSPKNKTHGSYLPSVYWAYNFKKFRDIQKEIL